MRGDTAYFIEDTVPLLSTDTKAPLKGNLTNVSSILLPRTQI